MWRTLFEEEKNKLRNLEMYIQNALNKTHTHTHTHENTSIRFFFSRNQN